MLGGVRSQMSSIDAQIAALKLEMPADKDSDPAFVEKVDKFKERLSYLEHQEKILLSIKLASYSYLNIFQLWRGCLYQNLYQSSL